MQHYHKWILSKLYLRALRDANATFFGKAYSIRSSYTELPMLSGLRDAVCNQPRTLLAWQGCPPTVSLAQALVRKA